MLNRKIYTKFIEKEILIQIMGVRRSTIYNISQIKNIFTVVLKNEK
jgi:hypothetical protein